VRGIEALSFPRVAGSAASSRIISAKGTLSDGCSVQPAQHTWVLDYIPGGAWLAPCDAC